MSTISTKPSKSARKFLNKIKKERSNLQKNTYDGNTLRKKRSNQNSMNAPVALSNLASQKTASISTANGCFMVKHREFVQDIYGTDVAFVVQKYPINPGLSQLFPWLSTIASRFQKYKFRKLRFVYETSAPSITQGYVFLVPDYDSSDNIPTTKAQALEFQSAKRGNVWEKFSLDCRPVDLNAMPQYYVRSALIPNTDIKTYDVGQLFTAMVGPPATSGPMGELWVDYEVELISPYIPQNPSNLSDLAISSTSVGFDLGFGLSRVTKEDNMFYSITSSGRILQFNQSFTGMLFVLGVCSAPNVLNISGATTDGTCTLLTGTVISSTQVYAYFFIDMSQGNYLAFDGWVSGTDVCQLLYNFMPTLQNLWI